MTNWYSNEDFWRDLRPFLFHGLIWHGASAEVQQGLTLLELTGGADILDLPCGPGRHCLEFARRGCRVTAVDLMPFYIEEGRRRARDRGVSIEFVQDDMRSFVRPDSYDAVWNFYSSFGYFDDPADDGTVLANFHRSLREGGKLLIETIGREAALQVWRDREHVDLPPVGDIRVTVVKTTGEEDPLMTWRVHREGRTTSFDMVHRYYSAEAISTLLAETGFTAIELYGDIYGTPYTPASDRMVVVAKK